MTRAEELRAAILSVHEQMMVLGREVRINLGIDDEIADAIAQLPGAQLRVEFYDGSPDRTEPYVIGWVEWTAGDVTLHAQRESRKATPEECAAAEPGLRQVTHTYRSVRL